MTWHAQWTAPALWLNWLPAKPLEDLRLAFKERADAAGETMPTGWQASFLTSNYLLSAADLAAFQSKMSTVISWYIDHTKTYDGTTTEPELWTDETITALTTAGTRLPAPAAGYLLKNDWLLQQYELINLLRHIRIYKGTAPPPPRFGLPTLMTPGKSLNAGAGTWADAISAFNAGTWVPSGGMYNHIYANFVDFSFTIQANNYQLDISQFPGLTLQYSADQYWKESADYDIWRPVGPQDAQGKWNILFTLPEGNGSRSFDLWPESYFEDAIASFSEPGDFESQGSYSNSNDAVIIGKFDGPNGFTYKDW